MEGTIKNLKSSEHSRLNRENRIKEIIKEILDNKDTILEKDSLYTTIPNLNKFESLVKDFDKYDRRKGESEEIKKKFRDRRDQERNRIISFLLQTMRNKIEFFEYELSIAREILKRSMPQDLSVIEGYDIQGIYHPSRQVGGDYYDLYNTKDGNMYFLISDVSGKGLPSSLIVASMKAYIIAQIQEKKSINKLIKNLNNYFTETLTPDKFVTMFIGMLDLKNGYIKYINAGHNPPVILKNEKEIIELSKGGTVLGMFEDISFKSGHIQLSSGDILTLYTDGVVEAFNSYEEMFSEKRLLDIIKKEHKRHLKEIIVSIFRELKEFCGCVPTQDDITLLFIRRK